MDWRDVYVTLGGSRRHVGRFEHLYQALGEAIKRLGDGGRIEIECSRGQLFTHEQLEEFANKQLQRDFD